MKAESVLADLVLGPHSRLTVWVSDVVRRLAQSYADRTIRPIDRFDRVDFLAPPRPIFVSFYPSGQMVDAIERGDVRTLYVMERPQQVLHYMKAKLGLSTIEAIRSQTASAVANLAVGRSEHVHIIRRDSARTVGQIVGSIARHMSLLQSDERMATVVADVSGGLGPEATLEQVLAGHGEHDVPGDIATSGLPDDALEQACGEILTPLLAMARGNTMRPVVWPTPVFTYVDMPEAPAPRDAEIAGPVRNLYYGPYLHLPPAHYRVEAILEFSDEVKDEPFVLEVHGGNWLSKARIVDRRAGNYRGYFYLDHHEPTATVEIRLRSEKTIARGRLSLIELLFFVEESTGPAVVASRGSDRGLDPPSRY